MTKGAVGNDMDQKTRKALKESIAHWYRISACETVEELKKEGYRSAACPLCQKFDNYMLPSLMPCSGCPVMDKADRFCYQSPYYKAEASLDRWLETGDWYNTDQGNIEAEIRFLESLLEG